MDHSYLCQDDDCYYLWEWDGAPYSQSAITDFIGNFQKEMRFRDSGYAWQCKQWAVRHAAAAIARTMLPEWRTSTFVPVPPSKIKGDYKTRSEAVGSAKSGAARLVLRFRTRHST
jgi:hypothetical protein